MDQADYRVLAAIIAVGIASQWDRISARVKGRQSGSASDDRPAWSYRPKRTGPVDPGPSRAARAGAAWGRLRAGR